VTLASSSLRYRSLIATGGIGSGTFFAFNGDHTLGREESRSGRFLDTRDYCKLHIIAHYARVLLGSSFTVLPVGRVGDDERGETLLREMEEVGLDLRYVGRSSVNPTLNCLCFVYPDGSGGNLTVDDSACSEVGPACIDDAEPEVAAFAAAGMVLAAPEVPLAARRRLLDLGTRHGSLRIASFTSGEIPGARATGMLEQVDLLALNVDEAAALAEVDAGLPPAEIAGAARGAVRAVSSPMQAAITAGAHGSWVWDGDAMDFLPAHPVEARGTAGAGDAHLSGILAGLAAGLPLREAHHLGALAGAVSVTSPHTINPDLEGSSLGSLADDLDLTLPSSVDALLDRG
jgi:sugar/nucleoside kinase (ribokinase family)